MVVKILTKSFSKDKLHHVQLMGLETFVYFLWMEHCFSCSHPSARSSYKDLYTLLFVFYNISCYFMFPFVVVFSILFLFKGDCKV